MIAARPSRRPPPPFVVPAPPHPLRARTAGRARQPASAVNERPEGDRQAPGAGLRAATATRTRSIVAPGFCRLPGGAGDFVTSGSIINDRSSPSQRLNTSDPSPRSPGLPRPRSLMATGQEEKKKYGNSNVTGLLVGRSGPGGGGGGPQALGRFIQLRVSLDQAGHGILGPSLVRSRPLWPRRDTCVALPCAHPCSAAPPSTPRPGHHPTDHPLSNRRKSRRLRQLLARKSWCPSP
jgi:hypothetical protein